MKRGRSGSSLVEVIVACLVLAVIAVAGADYIFQTQRAITRAKDKRLALEAMNSSLEQMRAKPYADLTNGLARTYNLQSQGVFSNRFFDAENDGNSFDGLEVSVTNTTYGIGLTTRVSP